MYWASTQAIILYNKLNNYDIIGIHCTAPDKMKLIYIQTRLKGWGSPELALEIGKKKERRMTNCYFFKRNLFLHGSDLYNHFTCMFLVSVDRKFAGDYEYAS